MSIWPGAMWECMSDGNGDIMHHSATTLPSLSHSISFIPLIKAAGSKIFPLQDALYGTPSMTQISRSSPLDPTSYSARWSHRQNSTWRSTPRVRPWSGPEPARDLVDSDRSNYSYIVVSGLRAQFNLSSLPPQHQHPYLPHHFHFQPHPYAS